MAGRGKTPREGPKPKFTWDVAKLENGERFLGWIAGDYITVLIHKHKKLRCCLREYLPEVECPGCKAGLETEWKAYQPLYREPEKVETVGVFSEPQWATLDKLVLHQSCVVGREKGNGKNPLFKSPLWINPGTRTDHPFALHPVRSKPRDIADWLPTLWGYVGRISGKDLVPDEVAVEAPTVAPVEAVPPPKPKDLNELIGSLADQTRIGSLHPDGEYPFTVKLPNGARVVRPSKNGAKH